MAKASFKVNAATLKEFAVAGRNDTKAYQKSVELIKLHAVDGVLPAPYSKEWRTSVTLAMCDLRDTKANRALIQGDAFKKTRNAASARLKRRVADAGITNGTPQGRRPGTTNSVPPKATTEMPTLADQREAQKAKNAKTLPAVPRVASREEFLHYHQSAVAQGRALGKDAGKNAVLKVQSAFEAYAKAVDAATKD